MCHAPWNQAASVSSGRDGFDLTWCRCAALFITVTGAENVEIPETTHLDKAAVTTGQCKGDERGGSMTTRHEPGVECASACKVM